MFPDNDMIPFIVAYFGGIVKGRGPVFTEMLRFALGESGEKRYRRVWRPYREFTEEPGRSYEVCHESRNDLVM